VTQAVSTADIGVLTPPPGLRDPWTGRFASGLVRDEGLVIPADRGMAYVANNLDGDVRGAAERTRDKLAGEVRSLTETLAGQQAVIDRLSAAERTLRDMALSPSHDQIVSLREARRSVGRSAPVLARSVKALERAEATWAEVSRTDSVRSVIEAEKGMRHFLRVIKGAWWEERDGVIHYVAYAPRFRFGVKNKDGTAYWADVGPFRVDVSCGDRLGISIDPIRDLAHCSGRSGRRPNYHPHIWTTDDIKMCWGDFDELLNEARREGSPFGMVVLADKLLQMSKRGRLYTPMFRWWTHRPRSAECRCPSCKAGRTSGQPNGTPCSCFGCMEQRGKTWSTPGSGVLWADRTGRG